MTFVTAGPNVADADTALAFVFDTWAMLPRDGRPDPADEALDLALHRAFTTWREAKAARAKTP